MKCVVCGIPIGEYKITDDGKTYHLACYQHAFLEDVLNGKEPPGHLIYPPHILEERQRRREAKK